MTTHQDLETIRMVLVFGSIGTSLLLLGILLVLSEIREMLKSGELYR